MELEQYLKQYKRLAIGFSGGVDSVYLAYAAVQAGCDVRAYFIKSAFQPMFEQEDALEMAKELNIPLTIHELKVLEAEKVRKNPENRCYYCKQEVFTTLKKLAKTDGCDVLVDGTNASDRYEERPGMKALEELGIISPLRICGLTKEEIRKRSKEAGLWTWKKPSYACLATRIPTDMEITQEMLQKVETSENNLRNMGFTDFRVRVTQTGAKLQVLDTQMEEVFRQRKTIVSLLEPFFGEIVLDLIPRKAEG